MILASRNDLENRPTWRTIETVAHSNVTTEGAPYPDLTIYKKDVTHSAGWYEHLIEVNEGTTIKSLIPGQIDLSDFPWIRGGTTSVPGAQALFTRHGGSIRGFFQFNFGSNYVEQKITGVVPGTFLSRFHDLVYPKAITPGKQDYIFRNKITHEQVHLSEYYWHALNDELERNPECWAFNWDFTGIPIGFSQDGGLHYYPQHGGCPISPRHMVEARHFLSPVGSIWAFLGSDGLVYHATSIGRSEPLTSPDADLQNWYSFIHGDLTVHTLDITLPPQVKVYPVTGPWFHHQISVQKDPYYPHTSLNKYRMEGGHIYLDQNRRARFHGNYFANCETNGLSIDEVDYDGTLISIPLDDATLGAAPFASTEAGGFMNDAYVLGRFRDAIGGDSGSVNLYVLDSVNLSATAPFTTPWSGSFLDENRCNLLIGLSDADAIARGNLLAPTGLTVTVAPEPTL